MSADMPDLKTAIKDPVSIISRMMARIEKRLGETKDGLNMGPQAIIISGDVGDGKTTALYDLVATLKAREITAGGILAPRILEDGITTGYDIFDIRTGIRTPFMRLTRPEINGVERFTLYDEGYRAGLQALDPENNRGNEVVIVDEVGPLELRGDGWSTNLSELLEKKNNHIVIAVRKTLVEEVKEKFGISDALVFETDDHADRALLIREIADSIGLKS
jgi:iron complex transport system ATP-binding protein